MSIRGTFKSVSRSVLPKAIAIALFATFIAIIFHFLLMDDLIELELDGKNYTVYSSALAFLLVFRNGKAYSRWWDGVQHLAQLKADWTNACSQIVASTTASKQPHEQNLAFCHVLTRLFSILSCVAFKHVADMHDEHFEVLNIDGLDAETKDLLWNSPERPRHMMPLISQWIMNYVYRGIETGVVAAPAPVVAQFFTSLHHGEALVKKCHLISFTAIPLPYSVMANSLLVMHFIYTAAFAVISQPILPYMCSMVFCSIFAFWCINLISIELERPFGDDVNDINLHWEQHELNVHLLLLLDHRAMHRPVCHSIHSMGGDKHLCWSTEIIRDEGHETHKITSGSAINAFLSPPKSPKNGNKDGVNIPMPLKQPPTPLPGAEENLDVIANYAVPTVQLADDTLFRNMAHQQQVLAESMAAKHEQLCMQIVDQSKMQERHNTLMLDIAECCRVSLEHSMKTPMHVHTDLVKALNEKSGKVLSLPMWCGQGQVPGNRRSVSARANRFPA